MSTSSTSGATIKDGANAIVLPKHSNRLINEKSPYLLQHAHNPVDWYPWGPEAIKRAREENKLIFLSVGYSTCHWCHVMEHESFENESVASFMNENFINIKVDREERPDIDKIYMQFVLMMNGHGGWPMSVWLTPDLAPITAGTYFPPHDRYGIPSFLTVLKSISSNWQSDSSDLRKTGMMVINVIKKTLSEKSSDSTIEPGSVDEKMQQALRIFRKRFDSVDGGFGTKPKFPEVSRLNLLFHAYIISRDEDVLNMVLFTLEKIRNGGIHDHVFGGFARYAVDKNWHVPHFEKMLYDQGQLMSAYANAYRLTNDAQFLESADGIFRYIMRDLYHPAGGFFSGEDADSLPTHEDKLKIEGAFYAWTSDEIREAISGCAALYNNDMTTDQIYEIYAYHYNVKTNGNVEPNSDPHGHLTGKNILIVKNAIEETCSKFGLNSESLKKIINITNDALHQIREKRPRPHLDTKIITSWNGLVLSGLNKLANCESTKRDEYMLASRKLVEFARKYLYDKERRKLRRSCYGYGTNNSELADVGSDPIDGFLDDYAFLIKGLLDYYKASLDGLALSWAKELQDIQDEIFWDDTYGGYFYSQDNSCNVVRIKEDHDGAEPCGNSIAAHNLLLLSHYFDEDAYAARASRLLEYFADTDPFGYNLPEMMSALLLQDDGLDLVAVVGPETELTKKFVGICQKFYIPGMIIVHVDPDNPTSANNQRVQEKFKMIDDKPTVYICHQKVCRMPIVDPEKLEETLRDRFLSKERL